MRTVNPEQLFLQHIQKNCDWLIKTGWHQHKKIATLKCEKTEFLIKGTEQLAKAKQRDKQSLETKKQMPDSLVPNHQVWQGEIDRFNMADTWWFRSKKWLLFTWQILPN